MKNVQMSVDKNKKVLTITIDLTKEFGTSASGKNVIIASTGGNQSVMSDMADVKIGLNVYKPA